MTQVLAKGTDFGPYRLQDKLGMGGMGAVWKALDTRLERYVALKFLSPSLSDEPLSLARFQREGRVIARLNHPNILTVYEAGVQEKTPFICTEVVDGHDLSSLLKRTGRFSAGKVQDIAQQLLRALESIHSLGIVHRDIKPQNIMLRDDGILKILDFGIARPEDETVITAPGNIAGTPRYIAPELLGGQEPDARTDLFSVGAVLYELLTGQPAFRGKNPSQVFRSILHDSPAPLNEEKILPRVIMRALKKTPEKRFTSAREMREALFEEAGPDEVAEDPTTVIQTGENFPQQPTWLPRVVVAPTTAEPSLKNMAEAVHLEVNIRLGLCPLIKLVHPFAGRQMESLDTQGAAELDDTDFLVKLKLSRLDVGIKSELRILDLKSGSTLTHQSLDIQDEMHIIEDKCAEWVGSAITQYFQALVAPDEDDSSIEQQLEMLVEDCWVGNFESLNQTLEQMESLAGRFTESAPLYGRLANLLLDASTYFGPVEHPELRAKALEYAESSLTLDPKEPFGHLAMAKSCLRMRGADWEKALEHWKEAFRQAPGDLWIHIWRGFYDLEVGRPEMCIRRAQKLLEQAPEDLCLFTLLSLGHLSAGRFHASLESGERILRIRPQDSVGLAMVFLSDLFLGKVERALLFATFLRKQLHEIRGTEREDPTLEALVLLAECFENPDGVKGRLTLLLDKSERLSARVLMTASAVLKDRECGEKCLDHLRKYSYRNLPLLRVDPFIQEQFADQDWYQQKIGALQNA
jgi:serine/threonine protein kinase